MTQTPRDWQKDMEMCERYERDEGWSRRDLIAEQPQMTMYWLQEAKELREELSKTTDAYVAVCVAGDTEKARADAAEEREQRLKESYEKVIKFLPWYVRNAYGFDDIMSTLYPDTPAPTTEIEKTKGAN